VRRAGVRSAWLARARSVGARFAFAAAFAPALLGAPRAAGAANGFARYQPATVEAPVVRAPARHCTVTFLPERGFAGGPPASAAIRPPAACPGPWSQIVLELDTRVNGVQYDRIGAIRLDGRYELLRFSTAEPTRHGIRYRVERDVSEYAPLLRAPRSLDVQVENVVNKEYTGVIYLTGRMTYYEPAPGYPRALPANAILPVPNGAHPQAWLGTGRAARAVFARLPRNLVRARLDVYATNHGCDEFWYTNVPDDYAARHRKDQLCGGGPYRELDVWIDGRLANVVYPFPYIWTGGINPLLWRPLSAIHTLNVPPYPVDLDAWAGQLSDGRPHSFAVTVLNDRGRWPLDANLFLWTDPHRARTGGRVTYDDIARSPLDASADRLGKLGGTLRVTAARHWRVSGYVDTSHGRIRHTLESDMHFRNVQLLDLPNGLQNATQETTFVQTTTTLGQAGTRRERVATSYPLVADSLYPPPARSKPYVLVIEANVRQGLLRQGPGSTCAWHVVASATLKRKRAHVDALATGRTLETNRCSGTAGTWSYRKSAVDGRLR
jgi:hypothetical protein